jgi:hypothetical protein
MALYYSPIPDVKNFVAKTYFYYEFTTSWYFNKKDHLAF